MSSYICDVCKRPTKYMIAWDSYACLSCNRWQEGTCGDPECEFCVKRPQTPNPIPDNNS